MGKLTSHSANISLRSVSGVRRALATSARRAARGSDLRRWAEPSSLMSAWDTRTAQLAEMVPPNTTVLEFGAGTMALRRYLPESCAYIPSDLVARDKGILRYDLNAGQLAPLPDFDVAVFSGVLEYIHDVPRLLKHLHPRCSYIVASYAVARSNGLRARLRRRKHGWVNDYSAEEFVGAFVHAGFSPGVEGRWADQVLYAFRKQHVQPAAVRDV